MRYQRLTQWGTTVLMAGALTVLLAACSSTHIQSTRQPAALGAAPLRNMTVVGIDGRPDFRAAFENDVVRDLRQHGVEGAASYTQFSLAEVKGDRTQMRQRLLAAKAESVLYVRVADRDDFTKGPPATFEGSNMGDVYDSRYAAFTDPGGEINTDLGLGATLYRVSDGALLWSGALDTIMREDADALAVMQRIATTFVQQMAKDKVIP
jgi:hypothetical protein